MSRLFLLLMLSLSVQIASATAQSSEVIVYHDSVFGMFSNPLLSHPQYGSIFMLCADETKSTSLYRRYIGHWSISGDSLFLDSICTYNKSGKLQKTDFSNLLGGETPLFASWVTDKLHLIAGDIIQYVHDGWLSTYQFDTYIKIEHGIVKSTETVENKLIQKGVKSGSKLLNYGAEFINSHCPWLEKGKRIIVDIKYEDAGKSTRPSKIKIDIPRGKDLIPPHQLDTFLSDLTKFIEEKKLLPIYLIHGKYKSQALLWPIIDKTR